MGIALESMAVLAQTIPSEQLFFSFATLSTLSIFVNGRAAVFIKRGCGNPSNLLFPGCGFSCKPALVFCN